MLIGHFASGKANAETAPSAQPAAVAPGSFRPAKGQLEALKIVAVRPKLRTKQITNGSIATNDDTTTQVFSPCYRACDQVVRQTGRYGAEKGTPLMAVEASEFVQGQNDLIAAAAALNTATAQVKLTEAAENASTKCCCPKQERRRTRFQSQADLATAQGNLRSAEIALAAVRNRLRILGKTDEEIAALEAVPVLQRTSPEAVVRAPIAGTVILRQVGIGQNIQSAAAGSLQSGVIPIANLSERLADRQRARNRRASDEAGCAGRSAGAGLAGARVQGQADLDFGVGRSEYAARPGARGSREPRRRIEAADVRHLPHRDRRHGDFARRAQQRGSV